MTPHNTKLLLLALLISTLTCAFSLNSYAQEEQKKKPRFKIAGQSLKYLELKGVPDDFLKKLESIKNQEYYEEEKFLDALEIPIGDERTKFRKSLIFRKAIIKGWGGPLCDKPTCKDELLEELEKVQGDRNMYVEGYIINGSDIIGIIKESNIHIKIKDSVIEGSLDFSRLPEVEDKQEVNKVVDNVVMIINSEITGTTSSGRKAELSVFASGTQFNKDISFQDTIFRGETDFSFVTFGPPLNSAEREGFRGGADFSFTTFSKLALFQNAIFRGWADFHEAKFDETAGFFRATFSRRADFSYAIFSGWADFEEAIFSGTTLFPYATFSGEANFNRAIFDRGADFYFAILSRAADFRFANFDKSVFFREARFFDEFMLGDALFKEYADFRDTRIKKLNYKNTFSLAIIGARFDLRGARITEAHFEDMAFEKDVDFSDVEFGNLIIEEGFIPFSHFSHYDISDWKKFLKQLKERGTSEQANPGKRIWEALNEELKKKIFDLEDGEEPDDSLKADFIYNLNSILTKKNLYNEKSLKGFDNKNQVIKTLLEKDRNKLTHTEIAGLNRFLIQATYPDVFTHYATVFRFVTFESDAFFIRTEFHGDTVFENVKFKKEANFTNADFNASSVDKKRKFSLSYLNSENLIMKFEQLPEPESWVRDSGDRVKSFVDVAEEQKPARKLESTKEKELQPISQVLEVFEAAFRNEDKLKDSSQAYYHMKIAEKDEKIRDCKKEKKDVLRCLITTGEGLEWFFWGIPTGYGTKIYRMICSFLILLPLFAAIYYVKGRFYKIPSELLKGEPEFKPRPVVFPWKYFTPTSAKYPLSTSRKFFDAMRISKELILKLGYRNTTISGGKFLKVVVALEWILGYLLIVALIVTLTNTFPLLNKLLGGVF